METKYFVSHDGNRHDLFDTLEQAEHYILKQTGWTDAEIADKWEFVKKECSLYGGDPFSSNSRHSLWFIDELKLSNGVIMEVDGQSFDDYVESMSDERGTEEFAETKRRMVGYYLGGRDGA
ncbi:hypothetical protein CRG49_012650 [Neisseria sp. N95_16]|uniref:Uncharacterized protein n=1 Tax=Neisseria brasiliensis TaxID=2666100 RepID=A0A7X2GWR2_9NEIS|nr:MULTISPECIES: hypothetical protein [Neisseria]MRN37416.1 hypothetical protein [Neisseria brasiliensis]PJO08513.1 hypothetical protein CRG49_012650 [Neisseria sp. N95_16]